MSKVKMAFLGCGKFAGVHANRLKDHPEVEIVALCDVTMQAVDAFIDQHFSDRSAPQKFTDPAQMYAQAKPDAVTIVTPHTLHFAHATQAIDAGCHVLLEKPMVTSLRDARELERKTKEAGKILVVGYNTPCRPQMDYVRQTIRSGSLGRLQMVSGYISQAWKKLSDNTWRQNPELSGGGFAYDTGAHLLNSLCWSIEKDVAEVSAFIDNEGTQVDIRSALNIRFAGGVMASIGLGGDCATMGADLHYMFTDGRIDVDGFLGRWIKVFKGKEEITPDLENDPSHTPDANFIDAIFGRAEPRTSPRNGVIHSQLMDAVYESARTGRPAKPPEPAS